MVVSIENKGSKIQLPKLEVVGSSPSLGTELRNGLTQDCHKAKNGSASHPRQSVALIELVGDSNLRPTGFSREGRRMVERSVQVVEGTTFSDCSSDGLPANLAIEYFTGEFN